jgi:SAM-dependent methyltransferase
MARVTNWHEALYAGAAAHYAAGRAAYPPELADRLAAELGLDGTGRLLDVGCGPGSLTLLLAPHFAAATGVDADAGMLAEAARLAAAAGITTVEWRRLRAEELPADLGPYDVVTFAQSFHWMDRPPVAAAVRGMLAPGGACVHVHATTHQGVDADRPLPHPEPPRAAVAALVRRYLGPQRPGWGVPPGGPGGETEIYRAAGFTGPRRIELPGRVLDRTVDQVVAAVLSVSGSAPHLFGDRLPAFEADLRALLAGHAGPGGVFSQQMREIAVDVWRA